MFTPEIYQSRPEWTRNFHTQKMKVAGAVLDGVTIKDHVELLNKAGIDQALLLAVKLGRRGLEDSWELDPGQVADACSQAPDVFKGVMGINPYDSVKGTKELEIFVKNYGFVGAHLYPHWFEEAPDSRIYYPFYAKCVELNIPIQMQVGRCQRYAHERPMRNVGFPAAVDRIACDFPDLKLIGIHVGWPWTEEMISVSDKHENVFIGIDAYAPKYLGDSLTNYINSWGMKKVIFGTDWPVIPFDRAVRETKDLGLSDEAMDHLFHLNTQRIYGLV
jgi:predicted TIM-barrel fold metal-dependent hydrolase